MISRPANMTTKRLRRFQQPYSSRQPSLIMNTPLDTSTSLALLSLAMSFFTRLCLLHKPQHLLGLGSHSDNLTLTVKHYKVMLEQHVAEDLEVAARVALNTTKASLCADRRECDA